jgi:hypothetical protein
MYRFWDNIDPLWLSLPERLAALADSDKEYFPDFLIIGPPRTGTTWLASILRDVDGLFVPERKELHYFDHDWKRLTLAQYLDYFRGNEDDIKGEATPTYSLLPEEIISLISKLKPDLKIVAVVRNPIERSWSQMKHSVSCRENTFRDLEGRTPTHQDLVKNLTSDYVRSCNDYIRILERWLTCFDRSSFFVEYFETAVGDPAGFLARLIPFLGGAVPPAWDGFDLSEPQNASAAQSRSMQIDALLTDMYAAEMPRIAAYLQDEFQLSCPWNTEQAGNFEWPIWIQDIGQDTRILFDGSRYAVVDRKDDTVVAVQPYFQDLVSEILERGTDPDASAIEVGADAASRREWKRLMALLDALNNDQRLFEAESRLANLQWQYLELDADWKKRGERIRELESQLSLSNHALEELREELAQNENESRTIDSTPIRNGLS